MADVVAAKPRAEAEAAHTKTAYTKQEAAMKIERARIEANLEVLQQAKEAAAAEAKARILKAAPSDHNDGELRDLGSPPVDTAQRTKTYVLQY